MVLRLILVALALAGTSCASSMLGTFPPLQTPAGTFPACHWNTRTQRWYPKPCYVKTPDAIILFIEQPPLSGTFSAR